MKEIKCFLDSEEALSVILGVYCKLNQGPMVVCIAGQTCSGKTTFGKELANSYPSTSLLKMDDWFRDISDPKLPRAENGAPSFDWPQSYRWSELRKAVVSLAAGREIIYPCYDLQSNRRLAEHDLIMRPGKLVIVEGLYSILFCSDLALKPINVWAYAPFFERLQRRLKRDRIYSMSENEIIARVLHAESCFDRFGRVQAKNLDLVVCSAW
jgi:uridine kinase